jgi:hypothetical protein
MTQQSRRPSCPVQTGRDKQIRAWWPPSNLASYQTKLFHHGVLGSGFEFNFRGCGPGTLVTEDQHAVAAIAQLWVPFTMKTVRLGISLHPADELIAAYGDSTATIRASFCRPHR